MKKTKISLKLIPILIIMASIIVYVMPTAKATDTTHNYYFNKNNTITFIPHSGFGTQTISDFNEALYQWNAASNGYTLLKRHETQRHSLTGFPSNDGVSRIYRESNTLQFSGIPGVTRVYRQNTQVLLPGQTTPVTKEVVVEADILMNTSCTLVNGSPLSNEYDVWTVFIHEAGHVLGLDHPVATGLGSVMNAPPMGSLKLWLSNSDKSKLLTRLVTLY